MPKPSLLRDFAEDLAYLSGNLIHRTFDLTCLLAFGMLIYVTGIDSANAGQNRIPIFGIHASIAATAGLAVSPSHAPTACSLTLDLLPSRHRSCTQALILDPVSL